jgi:hypothetical protein
MQVSLSAWATGATPTAPVPPNPLPTVPTPQNSFVTCSPTQQRSSIDNMCPMLEGTNLPNCCPPLQNSPPLQCQYVIMVSRGQPTLVNSSYTVCQGGNNVAMPCCEASAQDCFNNPQTKTFIQRLIGQTANNGQSAKCCFETCPPATYWPTLGSGYTLYSGSASQCTGTTLNLCTYGAAASCPTSSPCPVSPPSTPNPVPGPSSGPSPSPSGTPAPTPTPTPTPPAGGGQPTGPTAPPSDP